MKQIIDKKWFRTDKFDIVEEYPAGYEVWPIGRANFQHECYIPLAKPVKGEYDWQELIDPTSLKAIKVESETLALRILKEASRKGVDEKRFHELVTNKA